MLEKIYPELIYVCPVTKESFGDKSYCEVTDANARTDNPLPCPYFEGVTQDGWGPSVSFDVILCNRKYHSSEGTANK